MGKGPLTGDDLCRGTAAGVLQRSQCRWDGGKKAHGARTGLALLYDSARMTKPAWTNTACIRARPQGPSAETHPVALLRRIDRINTRKRQEQKQKSSIAFQHLRTHSPGQFGVSSGRMALACHLRTATDDETAGASPRIASTMHVSATSNTFATSLPDHRGAHSGYRGLVCKQYSVTNTYPSIRYSSHLCS